MNFDCIVFERNRFLLIVYAIIFCCAVLVIGIINFPALFPILFSILLVGLVTLLSLYKKIINKWYYKRVTFNIEEASFAILKENIEDAENKNTYAEFKNIKKYKISKFEVSGYTMQYYLLKILYTDNSKIKYLFELSEQSKKAIENFNLKIIEYNKIDVNPEKIVFISDFYTSKYGLFAIRLSFVLLIVSIILFFVYQLKSSLGSILIVFSAFMQMYGQRKSQKILEEKLLNGDPLT